MTVYQAYLAALVPSGGAILAIQDCIDMNWDQTISCEGYANKDPPKQLVPSEESINAIIKANPPPVNPTEYDCFSHQSNIPWDRMKAYIKATLAKGPPANGNLW
jgi:hypothetical protein